VQARRDAQRVAEPERVVAAPTQRPGLLDGARRGGGVAGELAFLRVPLQDARALRVADPARMQKDARELRRRLAMSAERSSLVGRPPAERPLTYELVAELGALLAALRGS